MSNGVDPWRLSKHGKIIQLESTDSKKRAKGIGGRTKFMPCPGSGLVARA